MQVQSKFHLIILKDYIFLQYSLNHLNFYILCQRDYLVNLKTIKDIPKTKNGKIVELAVKQTIEGDQVKNLEALINPDSLNQFKKIKELYK